MRATHDFLTEADIVALRPRVRLTPWRMTRSSSGCSRRADDVPIGFMGLAGNEIAGLFLEPEHRRQGGGRRLVEHAQALRRCDITVDVNEQNQAARGFYEALGFVGRRPLAARRRRAARSRSSTCAGRGLAGAGMHERGRGGELDETEPLQDRAAVGQASTWR